MDESKLEETPQAGVDGDGEPDQERAGIARLPVVASAAIASVALMVTFRPALMLNTRLPTGGDMGADHYIPQVLRRLLPLRIAGWGGGWFAGTPMLQFYFPLPYVAIVALSAVLPYPIAFKIVATAGVASIPLAFYFFLRMTGATRTVTALGIAFGLAFIYNDSYTILGGNIDSTMAGEFAYAISLSICLVTLGVTYRRTHARPAMSARSVPLPALLIAIATMSHILPLAIVGIGFASMIPGRGWRRRLVWLASVSALGVALSGLWLIPLLGRMEYSAHPVWSATRSWALFVGGPACNETCRWSPVATLMVIAAIPAALIAFRSRDRWPWTPLAIALVGLLATLIWPTGAIFNLRWLPVFYVGIALSASYSVGSGIDWAARRFEFTPLLLSATAAVTAVVIGGASIVTSAFAPAWVSYNYSGYEAKDGWVEYETLMEQIRALPDGRILWEYSPEYQRFGTTRALELIPYWTGHRSMEGLLIESSITSPEHFIMQSEVSERGSGAVPGIDYPGFDFESGLKHMELYGIRYYVAYSDVAHNAARLHGLTEVSTAGKFTIFEIETGGEVVVPAFEPVRGDATEWRQKSLDWFRRGSDLDVPIAFPQGAVGAEASNLVGLSSGGGLPRTEVPSYDDASVQVTRESDGVIEFTTNKVGAPHLVRESWYPTWSASGAEGPYMVAPSVMLVFPTSEHVTLIEGPKGLDQLGRFVSVAALVCLVLLALPLKRRIGRLDEAAPA